MTSYILKDINDNLAIIESESEIVSNPAPIAMMGYSVIPDPKGTQRGRFEVDVKTGMLLNTKVKSEINGSMKLLMKEVPVAIKVEIKIDGIEIK